MKFFEKNLYLSLAFLSIMLFSPSLYSFSASSFKDSVKGDIKNVKADNWSISGDNIIVKGNVIVPLGEYDIFADYAVINIKTKDFDAKGNIQVYRKVVENTSMSPAKFATTEKLPGVVTKIKGITTDVFGEQSFAVEISRVNGTITAETFSGNATTGFFQFSSAQMTMGHLVFRAASGERLTNGIIKIYNAEVSSCEYLASQNAHYSVGLGSAEITPYDTTLFGAKNAMKIPGEYSIFATNCTVKVYGVPVLWLPIFHKPKDENLGLLSVVGGKDSDWGFFVLTSKRFELLDYPATRLKVMADYYEQRGFGYGASLKTATENSKTSIFAYSIYDKDRFESNDADDYDLDIPNQRYDFRISHLNHITPTLDFRGNFELMSDEFINNDFFNDYYNANPQPVTFLALEKQFDRFSASLYLRPRVNSFFDVVEQLPSGRIDIPRQEIFDTNIYYQGETSFGYYRRLWADNDWTEDKKTLSDLEDYESGRFDTLHFFYFPIKLDFLNIIPRAGFRLTAYSKTSESDVTDEDLAQMFVSSDVDTYGTGVFNNYDDKGGSQLRFAGELGLEMNTKIYNSWQDIRSSFLQLDGLRHVIIPYFNYTYIPEPTLSRENIYYFDDIDRIQKQNFIRLGLINRLSTRDKGKISNYMTMENYWDYHLEPEEGYSHIGDFCTKITAKTPINNLTLSTYFAVALATSDLLDDEDYEVYRQGYNAGNPGLYLKWLSRFSFNLTYEPVPDYIFNLSYEYENPYISQSSYSMGSSLTDIDSGSAFDNYNFDLTQEIVFGASFPITTDRRTFGRYLIEYDVNAGFITSQNFAIIRKFHCIEVAAELEIETEIDDDNKKEREISFFVTAQITGLMGPAGDVQNHLVSSAKSMQTSGEF